MSIRRVGCVLVSALLCASIITPDVAAMRTAQPGTARGIPAAPSGLQAILGPQGQVGLLWIDNSNNEVGFRIVREHQVAPGVWKDEDGFTVGANVITYTDSPPPGSYRYRVRAYSLRGNSSYTPRVEIVVTSVSQIPSAPTGLSVIDNGGGEARVAWTDTSNNEAGFDIERQPSFSSSPLRVGANVISYIDATPGGNYAYRVRSVNPSGASSYTPWVAASIQPPTTSGFPPILPGSGFAGPTAQPPAVGSPTALGYDAKAIARWDVVPFQTFTTDFNVGVVAFHMNGIDRVDFSANGGPWVSVHDMQLNPQTNVWEYTAKLRATDFADGQVQVRAIVYPVVGTCRVLQGTIASPRIANGEHSMYLNANAGGSVTSGAPAQYVDSVLGNNSTGNGSIGNPYRTIKQCVRNIHVSRGRVDDCVVYLKAGNYDWAGDTVVGDNGGINVNTTGWLTITAAPGVARSAVVINANNTAGSRLNVPLIRWKNVTMTKGGISSDLAPYTASVWFDGCVLDGLDRTVDKTWAGPTMFNGGIYSTDSTVTRTANGPYNTHLIRNQTMSAICSDTFQDARLILNCAVDDVNPTAYNTIHPGDHAHPDVIQLFSDTVENVICYGLKGTNIVQSQGIYVEGTSGNDMAFVNVELGMTANSTIEDVTNILLWHISSNGPFIVTDNWGHVRLMSHRNCSWASMSDNLHIVWSDLSNITDNNHVRTGTRRGTNSTLGDPFYVNGATNLMPLSNSPLLNRALAPHLVPVDVNNSQLIGAAAIGALQP